MGFTGDHESADIPEMVSVGGEKLADFRWVFPIRGVESRTQISTHGWIVDRYSSREVRHVNVSDSSDAFGRESYRPRTPGKESKVERGKITIGVRKDRHSVVTSNGDDPNMKDNGDREMGEDQPVRDSLPPATVPNAGRVQNEPGRSNGSKDNENPINPERHIRQIESNDQTKDMSDGAACIDHRNDSRKNVTKQLRQRAATILTLRG